MWIRGAEDELINLDSVNHIFAGEDRGNAVLCVCINGDSQETSIYGFDCDEGDLLS